MDHYNHKIALKNAGTASEAITSLRWVLKGKVLGNNDGDPKFCVVSTRIAMNVGIVEIPHVKELIDNGYGVIIHSDDGWVIWDGMPCRTKGIAVTIFYTDIQMERASHYLTKVLSLE